MSIRNRKKFTILPRSSPFLNGHGGESEKTEARNKIYPLAFSLGLGVLALVFTLSILQASGSGKSVYIRKAFSATAGIQSYDAVIVGAGWAGISAAKALLNNGVDNILLLEAHDYIGGR